ncbi:MAG: PIN domain-containing protein [Granulosicoccus sp.]
MFANRFTALVDACSLVNALGRNTILSLAEAELFRVRWSEEILCETERALTGMFAARNVSAPESLAERQLTAIRKAFPDALVDDYEEFKPDGQTLPDSDDGHVIAAACRCRASILVTENLKHFPDSVLSPFGIETKTADDFIADTIDLDPVLAVRALATMRLRFKNPGLSSDTLLLRFESQGFIQTADLLHPYADQL